MFWKRMLLLTVLTLTGCANLALTGCAKPDAGLREPFASDRIRPLADFTAFTELAQFTEHAAYLEAGQRAPLKLRVENDWFGVEEQEIHLVVKRRIYLRLVLPKDFPKEKLERLTRLDDKELAAMSPAEEADLFRGVALLASPDAVRWASVGDGQALKDVFDIKSGNLSLGMGLLKSDGFWASLTLKLLRP